MVAAFENLTPYLSIVLLKIVDDSFKINSLRNKLTPTKKPFEVKEYDDGHIYHVNYQDEKRASWTDDENIKDIKNHVLIVYKINNYLALYHSDNSRKNQLSSLILRPIKGSPFKKIKFLRKEIIYTTFLKDIKVKNLWLSNVHDSSVMKASSKTLFGNDLEDSLDPIADQSYGFSAIKVEYEDGLSIGVNAAGSKIWMKKFSDNIIFFDEIQKILTKVKNIENTPNMDLIYNPIGMLANAHTNYEILKTMIDISLVNIEELENNSDEYNLLNSFYSEWDNYSFNFEHIEATHLYKVEVLYNGDSVVELAMFFRENNGFIDIYIISSSESGDVLEICKLLKNRNLVKYYFKDSQTIIFGEIYKQEFRDVKFNNFKWLDFSGCDVTKEKPNNNNFSLIGRDDSLFSWIKKYWKGTDDLVDYNQNYVEGWLLCDDGAGEKADFIHISNEEIPIISLIHAKGANSNSSNRRIAVTAYEIVVSQSIKNIKYLDKNSISESIENANINVENLVWKDGQQSSRSDLKVYLNSLEQYKTRVVILQPHVKEEKYNDINISDGAKLQRSLLSNLLISAQSTVQSLGAEFVVIGEG